MRYIADLHVHSHHSRATSRDLNLESLCQWAKIKGINVVGTGDFTHPAWFAELREKLQPDGNGFFILKDPPENPAIPGIRTRDIDIRFCLTTEISSIYKHGDRVRKNHNLLFAPDFDAVTRINHTLSAIGNLEADGRPILGLSSRDLLEIVLETSDRVHLIPAHAWTPWFSTLGSKAGYDSVDACFRDLTHHIFALETGLSSDPAMNRKVSGIDRFVLISNSDAHSPPKLGREANLVDTDLTYDAMFEAFRTGNGLTGTFEFYPEEGKYHHDGHRKCGISLKPEETKKFNNICPECGKPLTVGVLHRVEELADREEPAGSEQGFEYIIPLPEVLGEIENVGANTKTVRQKFQQVISTFGNEFDLLRRVPVEDIQKNGGPVLAEAIRRIRKNEVIRNPGYDGVYGEIKVFKEGEIEQIRGQLGFFGVDEYRVNKTAGAASPQVDYHPVTAEDETAPPGGLNGEQEEVCRSLNGATLVKAGPGTGKTHTLVEWIARQVESRHIRPEEIVAVTFTNKAAEELRERLAERIGGQAGKITAGTFHALSWRWLREYDPLFHTVYDASARKMTLRILYPDLKGSELNNLNENLERYLETDQPVSRESQRKIHRYQEYCRKQGAVDLSGLIRRLAETFDEDPDWLATLRKRYRVFAVDELQDMNPIQYQLIEPLAKSQHILAIGDPDQAIYGFRGSDVRLFFKFLDEFEAREIVLTRNYRSTRAVLNAAGALIRQNRVGSGMELRTDRKNDTRICLFETDNSFKEAETILDQIERFVGGIESLTSGAHTDSQYCYAFGDIAVLFRTHAVGDVLFKSFIHAGIPVHYGDGTAFLNRPPFSVVAEMFRICMHPGNYILFGDLMQANYGWSRQQVHSLIASQNSRKSSLFEKEFTGQLPDNLQNDFEDFRTICETVSGLIDSQQIANAVIAVSDHFLAKEELTESGLLKLETLIELAEESDRSPEDFLEQMQLNPYTDAGRLKSNAVRLLTFHASKGLEFPVVIIAGADEGITPLNREGTDLEEERRLFYVAMTRAKDELQITCTEERILYGERCKMSPSRFISEIPDDLLRKAGAAESSTKKESLRPESGQLGLF